MKLFQGNSVELGRGFPRDVTAWRRISDGVHPAADRRFLTPSSPGRHGIVTRRVHGFSMDFGSNSAGGDTGGRTGQGFPRGDQLRRVLEAVGAVPWPSLAFQAGPGSPVMATRMLASVLVHAYSRGFLASEEIEEACRVDDDFRYLCSGDAPEARVLRRFRRMHGSALVESLSHLGSGSGSPTPGGPGETARRCLEAAIAADSLALDF